jgi:hypothetical protein
MNRAKDNEPDVQWKAAAFERWHEPDDARVLWSRTVFNRAAYWALVKVALNGNISG